MFSAFRPRKLKIVWTIGITRTKVKIALRNLAFNMDRLGTLTAQT